MKTLIAIFVLCASGLAWADQHLYLSAGDKVSVYRIDAQTGELASQQAVELTGAGPMTASWQKDLLYVNSRIGKQPAIATLRVNADGSLELAAKAASGMSAGYLCLDKTGSYLAGNNYGQGKAATWSLSSERVFEGQAVQQIELEKRAHSTVFSPDNRFLLVPATGPNKVFQLVFDQKTGQVRPNAPPYAEGPQGEAEARQPRHLVFHPNKGIVYTTNEREQPGVGVWKWHSETGRLATIQNIVTQPKRFHGLITTADLHLTPDAEFLYVSNRDVTDRKATAGEDSIVGFRVDAKTGRLTRIGHFPCEHVPRSFAVDETGSFVYVAGQGDDKLGAYRIDGDTGELTRIAHYQVAARPSWVHCMTPGANP